jgi:ketosteroid isomerase-like protein
MQQATTNALAAASLYFDALAAKDFATINGILAEDIVWHQPGDNRFSGSHNGAAAVGEMIGAMMAASEGTLHVSVNGAPMANGTMVAMPVQFSAQRDGAAIAMVGVDLMRFEGDRIVELWLFSEDQSAEDAFWGTD